MKQLYNVTMNIGGNPVLIAKRITEDQATKMDKSFRKIKGQELTFEKLEK